MGMGESPSGVSQACIGRSVKPPARAGGGGGLVLGERLQTRIR